ncbi:MULTISPECIES: 30S ribosomal protein S20 [Aminobacterium]|uniref:30S ribosomal protein S20 n=1 Tax=Aminobacterium TaxID=81466 RepID=UPI002580E674|nr:MULTISPECIES: 30S ribosomal protein S20 [unclassified Aminobacterium]
MPNKKSAEKRMRTSEKNRLYNRYWSSRCKTAVKKVLEAVDNQDTELAEKRLQEAQSVIDKAIVKGVMHRNTGARRKSLLTNKVKTLAGEVVEVSQE